MLSANRASQTTSRSWSGNSRPNKRRTHRLQRDRATVFVYCGSRKVIWHIELQAKILTCRRFAGRSPAGWGACAVQCRASSPAGPGCGWLWSLWQRMAPRPGAERRGCWSTSLLYPGGVQQYVISISWYKHYLTASVSVWSTLAWHGDVKFCFAGVSEVNLVLRLIICRFFHLC